MKYLQREILKIGKFLFFVSLFFLISGLNKANAIKAATLNAGFYNNYRHQDKSLSLMEGIKKRFNISGNIQVKSGNQIKEDRFEDKRYINTKIKTELKYNLSNIQEFVPPKKRSYATMSFKWDLLYFENDPDYRDENVELYEGYLVLNKGPLRLRVGKQIIRWGKTDQISPVDNLNSQDFRLLILSPYEERKIPNWMVDAEFFGKNLKLEMVLVPFVEPNEVYFFDRNFAIFKQLKKGTSYFLDSSNIPLTMRDYIKDYVKNLQVDKKIPSKSVEDLQGGVRLGFSFEEFDMALSYLRNFDPNPYIKYFPVSGIKIKEDFSGKDFINQLPYLRFDNKDIIASYIKRNIYGFEFEGVFDNFGIRGEVAYFDKSAFLCESLKSTHKANIWYVLGADYNGENDLYLNIQLSHQHIFDYKYNILYFRRNNISLLGELSKGFAMGDYKCGVKYSYFISDHSYFINPYIILKNINNLEIEFGSFLFGGDMDSILGQYHSMDELYINFKFYF